MSGVGQSEEGEASTSGVMETSIMETEEYYNTEDTSTWTQKEMSEQLCRICAKPNQYLIPIFEGEGIEHQLETKIQKHLPIEVSETDELPLQVCYQCASTLIAWNDLVIACIEADKKLRQALEHQGEEDEKGAEGVTIAPVKFDQEFFDEPDLDSDDGEESTQPNASPVAAVQSDTTSTKKSLVKTKKSKLETALMKGTVAGPSGQKTSLKKTGDTPKDDAVQEETERCHLPLRRLLPKPAVTETTPPPPSLMSTQFVMIKVENVNPMCNYCGLSFNFNSELASHIAANHFEDVYHCVMCDSIRYESKDEFANHMKMHSSVSEDDSDTIAKFCAPEVTEATKYKCDADEKSKLYCCGTCGMEFTNHLDFKIHRESQQCVPHKRVKSKPNFSHPCYICKKSYTRSFDLKRHITTVHKDSANSISDVAKLQTEVTKIRKTGRKRATDSPVFICSVCKHSFTRRFDLKRHLKTVHSVVLDTAGAKKLKPIQPSVLQVQNSPKTASNIIFILPASSGVNVNSVVGVKSEVTPHVTSRKDELITGKDFPCYVCKKSFNNLSDLGTHYTAHSAEEKTQAQEQKARDQEEDKQIESARVVVNGRTFYKCNQCDHHILARYNFIRHLRIHTGQKPFTCHVCGKQFRVGTLLSRHVQDVHERLKRYPCDICGRRFANSSARNDHRRTHTGERPFVCHICGKAFKSKSCLFIHNRFHSNNFPHKCTFCEKKYRTRQQLKEHITLHTGEKPNTCNLCGKAFRLNSCLRRHRNHHERKERVDCEICGKSFPQLRYLKLHVRTHNSQSLVLLDK